MSSVQRAHVGLPHPELDLLVEQLDQRQRVRRAAVDPEIETVPPRRTASKAVGSAVEPVDAGLEHQRLGDGVGQQPDELLGQP